MNFKVLMNRKNFKIIFTFILVVAMAQGTLMVIETMVMQIAIMEAKKFFSKVEGLGIAHVKK